jgi:ankyrin repeat protein
MDHGNGDNKGPDESGLTDLDRRLLSRASESCSYEDCAKLLDQGADVNARDEEGSTPLLWAVLSGRREVVELMVAGGADVNRPNLEGETPLHWASTTGNTVVAEYLLARGAEVNVRDMFGVTPMRSALLNEDRDMIRILKSHGGTI